ncbi:MAG: AMP-binding protein [Anaerolineaceae bacterium]|nr:AMP-binding protein [Anaerolineaceae bacterium]
MVTDKQTYPLSIAQKRLWFLHQYHKSGINNTVLWLRISGKLDIDIFKASIRVVVDRHQALRTHIVNINGDINQIFEDITEINFRYTKINEGNHLANNERLFSSIHVESMQSFDLQKCPLFFTHLYELPENEYYFAWVLDHINSDGVTLTILTRDIIEAYQNLANNQPTHFSKETTGYGEYTVWESNRTEAEYEGDQEYWRQKLENIPTRLAFPTLNRPIQQTFHGANHYAKTNPGTHQIIKTFCKSRNITPFIFFSSVFALLVYRYTAQDDFVLGMPTANRNQLRFLNTAGFFVNTFLLRCQINDQMTFSELLEQVRKNSIEAYDHNSYPFEKTVEMLHPDRDTTRNPLFQFFLNTRAPKRSYKLTSDLQIEILTPPTRGSNFDLTAYFQDSGDIYEIEFSYNPDVLSDTLLHVFINQLISLCEVVPQHPNFNILQYSLILPEPENLLPDPTYPLPIKIYPTIIELFHQSADRFADHIAVCWRGKSYTYQQLLQDSTQISCFVLNQGYAENDVIALSGSSSYGLISTLLGILQSGCTILLLDPTLPEQRKRVMLNQSNAKLLFYSDEDSDSVVAYNPLQKEPYNPHNGQLVNPDEQYLNICKQPEINPLSPAYITFTSGTSGVPKGVLGIHNGLSHFLLWQKDTFKIDSSHHFAQMTNIGFDVIFRDILLPLISGATLHCPPQSSMIASRELFDWFRKQKINVLHTVPSLARYWLENNEPQISPMPMKLTFFAGEKLTRSDCINWQKYFSGRIVNLYGPSETTLATSYHIVDKIEDVQPIGKPIPGSQLLILNNAMQLAGIGEPGQIVIRSSYRTAGYLHRQEKHTFIPNPFTDDPKDLLYQSGDMGRFMPDGSVLFLGRMDQQIKILGNRVEPEEVHAVLMRHPHIKNIYIKTHIIDENTWPVLVAYIVPIQKNGISVEQVRDYLQQYVGSVSIPQHFHFLSSIPVNRNGKVDSNALPGFDPNSNAPVSRIFKKPRNETEAKLLSIWQKHLPRQNISIDDNFFQLGGHSLLAMNVCVDISESMQKKISLATFFRFPSISQLSEYFQNPTSDINNPILPLQTFGEKPALFCANMRNGSASIYRLLIPYLSIDQPLYGLSIYVDDKKTISTITNIEDAAKMHVEALLAFDPHGPYYLCGYSFAGLIALEIAHQLELIGKQVAFLGIIDTWLEKYDGFNLSLSPMQKFEFKVKKALRNSEFHIRQLNHLPFLEKIEYIRFRVMKKVHRMPVDPDQLLGENGKQDQNSIDVNNLFKRLADNYQPPVIQSKITLFRAMQPSSVFHAYPSAFGWHRFSKRIIDVLPIPGSHYSMVQGNEIRYLGAELQAYLDKLGVQTNE